METLSEQDKMDQIIAELTNDVDEFNNSVVQADSVKSEPETETKPEAVQDEDEQDVIVQTIAKLNNIIEELNDENDNITDQNDSEPDILHEKDDVDHLVEDMNSNEVQTDPDPDIVHPDKNTQSNSSLDDFAVLDDEEIEEFDVESTNNSIEEKKYEGKQESDLFDQKEKQTDHPVSENEPVDEKSLNPASPSFIDKNSLEDEDKVCHDNNDKEEVINKPKFLPVKMTAALVLIAFIVAFIAGWFISDMDFVKNQYRQKHDDNNLEKEYKADIDTDRVRNGDNILERSFEEIERIRNASIEKKEKIAELISYYKKNINDIEIEIINEKHKKNISIFREAIANKKIEFGLRTIQRRKAYIESLKGPYEELLSGIEELYYIKRKIEIEAQMIPFSTGIDVAELKEEIDSVLQKHVINMNDFELDTQNLQFDGLEEIWDNLISARKSFLDKSEFKGFNNETIFEDMSRGDFSKINFLTKLSSDAAYCLSKWEGKDLYLNKLTSIDPDAAKNLALWKGQWVCLNGLEKLSPEAAEFLSKWRVERISLNGLKELSSQSAKFLSRWEGRHLELIGIKKISADALRYLKIWSKSGGTLYMDDRLLK